MVCSTTRVSTWAIVVAAGGGTRFGAAKQFARLGGATVLDRSLRAALRVVDGAVVVLPPDSSWMPPDGVHTAIGGATRSESVRAGLACVPADATVVVVHDAARPLASPALFRAVIDAVHAGADAAVPALAIGDTIKHHEAGGAVTTVDRDGLHAAQTPQAFAAAALRAAHSTAGDGTDDAMLVETAGGTVVLVPGERRNFKITVADDLEIAAALVDSP